MASKAVKPDIDVKKLLESGTRDAALVLERLDQLVKKRVISEHDSSYTPVVSNGRTVPRIIWTIERLLVEGHLAGIEDAVKGFSYLVGKGLGSQRAVKNKQGKYRSSNPDKS